MVNTAEMKIPDSIPKEEVYAILGGDYDVLGKQNITLGLSEEARRLLGEEASIYGVRDRTKALEILLRERREARRAAKK